MPFFTFACDHFDWQIAKIKYLRRRRQILSTFLC
jgi:hypothetical protein